MRTIDELEIEGRRVFVRVDFNVPLDGARVTDTTRIDNALETVRHAIGRGARVVLASHLGRPKGSAKPEFSLAPVARELAAKLDCPVTMTTDCVGDDVERQVAAMADGDVVLLENLRFHAGEEKNDPDFAKALAALADVYVNDAFGTAHRAHASTAGMVGHFDQAGAGFLLRREIEALSGLVEAPPRPFVAILGGAKVSDKIALIENLLGRVDAILVGGAMAYTFLAAQGVATGASRVEGDRVELAGRLLADAASKGARILLPIDHVVAAEFSETATPTVTEDAAIADGQMGLDIGPRSRAAFGDEIAAAKTILWNGPMGVFEWESFRAGTLAVADAVADSAGHSVVGGGDSVAALAMSGRGEAIDHISTGGGASLEFLEGKELPGVAALEGHRGN